MTLAWHEILIHAPRELVYEYLTDAERMLEWIAVEATVIPAVDGTMRWTHPNGMIVSGRFVEVDRPGRVVFTYGWETRELYDIPPGSTTVTVELHEHPKGTLLKLEHRGLPDPKVAEEHRSGWEHFTIQLAAALAHRVAGDRSAGEAETQEPV